LSLKNINLGGFDMKIIWATVLILLLSLSVTTFGQKIQAIHNAADPELALVDVTIKVFGSPVFQVDSVPFREALPIVDAIAGIPLVVEISKTGGPLVFTLPITLSSGLTYIGQFVGVVNPAQFAPNPDGLDISIDAVINENGRETSSTPGKVDLFFLHGVTDAPTLDIDIHGGAKLVDNCAYGNFSDYFSLDPSTYAIDITNSSGSTVLYSYALDLNGYADSALALFASGFVDPNSNQNGEPFGLFAATPGGNVIEFSTATGIGEPIANEVDGFVLRQNYPNPFNPATMISYQLATESDVELTIYNVLGQEIRELVNQHQSGGIHQIQWNGRDEAGREVASGVYLYKLSAGDFVQSRKMLLLK
jgi:hypothetical protein